MGDGKTRTPMSQKEWLAFEDGVNWERARVIKLLEDEKFILPEGIHEGLTLMPIQDAIALIKGENKTNPWTSRPLTEEDKEHYGLKGENK